MEPIIIDAIYGVTGIDKQSAEQVAKILQDTINKNAKLKLDFDEHGSSAMIDKINVVRDGLNEIKSVAANIKLGDTTYNIRVNQKLIEDIKIIESEIEDLNSKITTTQKELNKAEGILKRSKTDTALTKWGNEANRARTELEDLNQSLVKSEDLLERLSASAVTQRTGTSFETREQEVKKYYKYALEAEKEYQKAIISGNEENIKTTKQFVDSTVSELERVKSAFREVVSPEIYADRLSELGKSYEDTVSKRTIAEQTNAQNQLNSTLKEYEATLKRLNKLNLELQSEETRVTNNRTLQTKESQNYINKLKEVISSEQKRRDVLRTNIDNMGGASKAAETFATAEDDAALATAKLSASLSQNNSLWLNFSAGMKDAIARVLNYTLAYKALYSTMALVKDGISTAIDLNKSFVAVQTVIGGQKEDITELALSYADLAQKMGITTKSIADGSAEWFRQGKTIEEVATLLESTAILSKVGNIEASQSTEYLTAVLNGFKLEAEESMRIVDALSAVDLVAATSTSELAEALSRTSFSAREAGIGFEELTGWIGAVSEATRQSAASIGESFKTIFARLGNVAAGKDIDDEGEKLNDVEKALERVGIRMRTSTKEWRNFGEVISEVADNWKIYTSVERSQIATAIAGTRQRERYLALMDNWARAQELVTVALESEGSAQEKYQAYLDGTEAALNKLTAEWEKFVIFVTNNSNFLQGPINAVTGLVSALNFLVQNPIGKFISTFALVTAAAFAAEKVLTLLGTKTLKVLGNAFAGVQLIFEQFATKGIGGAISAIKTLIATAGTLNVVLAAVSIGIGVLVAAWSAYSQSVENAKKKQEELVEKAKEVVNSSKQEVSELDTLISKYEELKRSENKDTSNRTEIAKIQGQIVNLVGQEVEGLDLVNGALEDQLAILKNISAENIDKQLMDLKSSIYTLRNDLKDYDILDELKFKELDINKTKYGDLKDKIKNALGFSQDELLEMFYGKDAIKEWGEYFTDELESLNIKDIIKKMTSQEDQIKLLENLKTYYSSIGESGNKAYIEINRVLTEVEAKQKSLNDATFQYDTLKTWADLRKGVIDTQEAYDDLINSIENNNTYSSIQKKDLIELSESIYPQYIKKIEESNETTEELETTATKLSNAFDTLKKSTSDFSKGISFSNLKDLNSQIENLSDARYAIKTVEELKDSFKSSEKSTKEFNSALEILSKQFNLPVDSIVKNLDLVKGLIDGNEQAIVNFINQLLKLVGMNFNASNITSKLSELKKSTDETTVAVAELLEMLLSLGDLKFQNPVSQSASNYYDEMVRLYGAESVEAQAALSKIFDEMGGSGPVIGFEPTIEGPSEKKINSSSSKSSTDEFKNYVEELISYQKYLLDKRLISEKEYYDNVENIIDNHYKNNAKYLEDYRKYEIEILHGREKLYEEEYDKEANSLKYLLDRKIITELEYYKRMKSLNDKYYKDLEQYADTWEKNDIDAMNGISSAYENMINEQLAEMRQYISDNNLYNNWQYDNQIDVYRRMKDLLDKSLAENIISWEYYANQVAEINREMFQHAQDVAQKAIKDQADYLNNQLSDMQKVQRAALQVIDDQIAALNDQKKALQDANKEKEKAIELEELENRLRKANQLTNRVYYEGRGESMPQNNYIGQHPEMDKTEVRLICVWYKEFYILCQIIIL